MANSLDMHTVFIVCSSLNMVIAVGMLLVYLTGKTYPGFVQWTLSSLGLSVALTLFAYPQLLPSLVVTTFGNVMFCLFPVLFNRGLRLFAGRQVTNTPVVGMIAYSLAFSYYFSAVHPDMLLRVATLTLAIVPFYIDSVWFIWRNPAFRYPIVRPLLAGVFGALAFWNLLRLGLMVMLEPGVNQIWTPSLVQGLTMIIITAAISSVTTGFIVLNFQRASATVQQQERRLSLAVGATQDAIWEWNVQTHETYYSPRWYEILGRPAGAAPIDAATWESLCHPDDLPAVNARIQAAISNPRSASYLAEFRMRHSDGSWRWIQGRGRVVERDAKGQPRLVSGTSTDITEALRIREQQARLEAQLHQSQKMEALGTLAGGIAHDFNNILVGILGNLQLAEMELPEDNPAVALLKNAHKACRRARDLIARIMTFSHKGGPTRQAVAVGSVVAEVAALVRASLPSNIAIEQRIAPHCPPFHGDAAEVHEVLMNLIVNSAAALGEKGGLIEISLEYGPPSPAIREQHPHVSPDPQLQLAVRDNGSGMSPDVQSRIFEPFFSTKGPGQGSGIGLTMVHRIVTDAGGTIAVDSVPGQGSKLTLFLPADPAGPALVHSQPPHAPVRLAQGRVLIVDDEPDVLDVTKRALQQVGLAPEVHARPADALAAFKFDSGAYVAILTDLSMPQMSGLELSREIRRLNPHVPIVIMTGHLTDAAQASAAGLGGVQFVRKPFELAQLQSLVVGHATARSGPT